MSGYFSHLIAYIIGAFSVLLALVIAIDEYRGTKEIVSHGCAQYNSKTSDFEWIDTITKAPTP